MNNVPSASWRKEDNMSRAIYSVKFTTYTIALLPRHRDPLFVSRRDTDHLHKPKHRVDCKGPTPSVWPNDFRASLFTGCSFITYFGWGHILQATHTLALQMSVCKNIWLVWNNGLAISLEPSIRDKSIQLKVSSYFAKDTFGNGRRCLWLTQQRLFGMCYLLGAFWDTFKVSRQLET